MISNHYDVVISGGHVIDLAQGIDGPRDVADFSGDRIAAVAERLPPTPPVASSTPPVAW